MPLLFLLKRMPAQESCVRVGQERNTAGDVKAGSRGEESLNNQEVTQSSSVCPVSQASPLLHLCSLWGGDHFPTGCTFQDAGSADF